MMEGQPAQLPIGLEMPLPVRRDPDFNPKKKAVPPSLADIKKAVKNSYEYTVAAFRNAAA
jgi:hypothetical protein